ncbi:MAG: response regulator [Chloroflexi bacterium]|nr:response regulator [Chloroflexota bacterium]
MIVAQRRQLQSVNAQLADRGSQIRDSNQRLMVEIAERKRAEAAARTAREKLESRVKERTDELSKTSKNLRIEVAARERIKEQFLQAQKMEAIGQLAGGIAHDFNNLLTAIMSYAQLGIMKLSRGERAEDYFEGVQTAAERASHLTRQLLAFSRRQVIEPRVVNLNDLVLDVDKMLRRLIGEDIELVLLPAADLGEVKVDPGQMEQVVLNMAVNSRDAMPHGGKIVIRTSNFTVEEGSDTPQASGRQVVLSISDTGVGIEEDVKPHIFEPFFTTKSAGKGTGLGLSTCYGIVDQNGGHIEVKSEPGRGTTFDIFLPRVDEPAGSLPLRDDPGCLPLGNEAVLLVEDEPLVREVTSAVLREQGYTVLTAANGHEALSIARHYKDQEIHLLLADVVMPLMGGRELSEQLKELHPETKVLYTSGYTDDMMVNYGFPGPASEFVQKPFTPAVLARKVREVLEK